MPPAVQLVTQPSMPPSGRLVKKPSMPPAVQLVTRIAEALEKLPTSDLFGLNETEILEFLETVIAEYGRTETNPKCFPNGIQQQGLVSQLIGINQRHRCSSSNPFGNGTFPGTNTTDNPHDRKDSLIQ
jgi:hypothetical protein